MVSTSLPLLEADILLAFALCCGLLGLLKSEGEERNYQSVLYVAQLIPLGQILFFFNFSFKHVI